MMSGTRFIRVTRAFAPLNIRTQHWRAFGSTPAHFESRAIPRIVSPSLWTAIVPRFLRERKSGVPGADQPKGWNPATYFIIMAILIGSQAIRILTLRNEYNNFVRTTDARIRALREVIEKIGLGEEVDVKGLLGTGNLEAEAEWQEMIDEIGRGEPSKPKDKPQELEQVSKETKPVNFSAPKETTKKGSSGKGNFF